MKCLFVSHEATRTGAPILLLQLIRWLKINKKIEIIILLINGGSLEKDFEAVGESILWNIPLYRQNIVRRILDRSRHSNNRIRHQHRVMQKLNRFQPDIIYYNSVNCCSMVPIFNRYFKYAKSILHVHELEAIIRQINTVCNFDYAVSLIDRFIAVSDMVKNNLVERHRIDPGKIDLVYEFIETSNWNTDHNIIKDKNIKFIIGCSGVIHWRKGPEFLILIANELKKRGKLKDIECWWIGKVKDLDLIVIEEDLYKLGLTESVKFFGETTKMETFFDQMDVFLITSREDPYPVVALEAALFSLPIICWNQGSGTLEFVKRGGGLSADYMDVNGMVDAILELKNNQDKRKKLGKKAHQLALKHDVSQAGEKIFDIMEKLFK